MKKIFSITVGRGGQFEIVKKINEYFLTRNLQSDIILLSKSKKFKFIAPRKFLDEEIVTPPELVQLKNLVKGGRVIFYHHIFNFASAFLIFYLKIFCQKKIIGVFHTFAEGGGGGVVRILYKIRKFFIINTAVFLLERAIFLTRAERKSYLSFCLFRNKLKKKSEIVNNFIEKEYIAKNKKENFAKLNLLFVGRLSRFKGFHRFLQLAENFSEDKDVKFTIAGKGKLYVKIPSQKNVRYLGAVSHKKMKKVYDRANILLITSYSEVFPLTILEAMARGLIILCSNIPGMKEIIKEKRNGYLYPSGDIDKIKDVILSLKKNQKEMRQISENNRKDIRNFTPEKLAEKYIEIYREVLKSKNGKED